MFERRKSTDYTHVEKKSRNFNFQLMMAVALLGILTTACAPKVWATQSQHEIKLLLQIQSDGDVRLDPQLRQNTVLSVTRKGRISTNLSENKNIPLTYLDLDVASGELEELEFTTFFYDENAGYIDPHKCRVKDDKLNILPNGYLELILMCDKLSP